MLQARLDYHLHSGFSYDNETPMEEMCIQAAELGLTEVAFTEHYDCDPADSGFGFFRPPFYFAELGRLREKWGGTLAIRAGLEFDQPHMYQGELQKVIAKGQFDLILGAVHFVDHRSVVSAAYFEGRSEAKAYRSYFDAVLDAVKAGGFEVLAHLDYVKTRGVEFYGPFDPSRFREQIEAILRALIDKGMGLEVNTAGLRRKVQEAMPGPTILRWYKELGGELVTIGSDAHRPQQLGFGLGEGLQALEEAGFSFIARYERRKPMLTPLLSP